MRAPIQHAAPLSGKAEEARTAVDQEHAQHVFELLMPADRVGWVNAAAFRRSAEMLLACQRQQEFQLVDHLETTERAPPHARRFPAS